MVLSKGFEFHDSGLMHEYNNQRQGYKPYETVTWQMMDGNNNPQLLNNSQSTEK